MPWLIKANARLDFTQGIMAVQCRGRWVALQTIIQQHSEILCAQHCNGFNASDLSKQNVNLKGAH